jgi:hypothetical protein
MTAGLGNQLFQYAAGYSAAKRLGVNFRINKNFYRDYPNQRHSYHLHNFPITAEITEDIETLIYQKEFNYKKITQDGSLYGYWQSEKYFKEHEEDIRREFYLPKLNIPDDYVMVAVRRTDYLLEPDLFNVLDVEYYEKARSYFPNCKFIGFSEDTQWMRQNLPWLDEISEGKTTIQDFKLMCSFKKFIIANSTFSWWAAWLSESDNVIAPQKWFMENAKAEFDSYDTSDIIPDRWIKI